MNPHAPRTVFVAAQPSRRFRRCARLRAVGFALVLTLVSGALHAVPPPGILNHQGRIVVNGVNPDGVNGSFKFALVDGAGTTTLWSHDGSSFGGSEPVGALQLAITQGHYAVGLGEPGLMQPIPPSVFTNNADVRLRIWFNDELLTPDRRITAAGYALTAGAVADPSFVGTTTTAPLDLSVNNLRGLRLEYPTAGSTPNIIGGSGGNTIGPFIAGAGVLSGGESGLQNSISGSDSDFATIVGGSGNSIVGGASTIGGGFSNTLAGAWGVIGGGYLNTIDFSDQSVISGGRDNSILGQSTWSAIGGGRSNSIYANAEFATIPGGRGNGVSGDYAFAAGRRAQANHHGAFVWADSTDADFSSTADNQFNVRAAGGARFFTGGTGLKLDTDTVVFSGSAQTGRFGSAANVDINPLTSLDGLLIEQGNDESSGLFFDGDSITMWSPGDNGRLFRILDEDAMTGGAVAAERFYVDGAGGVFSAGGASFAGNVGIGSTSPGATLDVLKSNANGAIANNVFQVRATYTSGGQDTLFEVFNAPGTVFGNLRLSGASAFKSGGGSWAALSDARLKKNVEDLHGSLDRLLRLRSVSFEYLDPAKGVGPGPQIGFIAQEVREVLPQWVTEGSDGMLAVSVTGFESLTVDALRELRAEKDRQIADLKTENAALQERLDRLERVVAALPLPAAAPMPANAAMEMK